jgi:hypothetical protein
MQLWMSAEVDEDICEKYRTNRDVVEADVNALLSSADYGGNVDNDCAYENMG